MLKVQMYIKKIFLKNSYLNILYKFKISTYNIVLKCLHICYSFLHTSMTPFLFVNKINKTTQII